jgi:hypothetical protein
MDKKIKGWKPIKVVECCHYTEMFNMWNRFGKLYGRDINYTHDGIVFVQFKYCNYCGKKIREKK